MRTRVILNPAAAAGRAAQRIDAVRAILDAAWPGIDWCTSASAEHLTRLCSEAAAEGFARVIVAGGDGTIHHAVRGLANTGTALGIVPLGTGNDFAKAAGLPVDPVAAARVLIEAAAVPVDLGSVNGVPFCCVAGIGMDTPALHFIASLPLRKINAVYQLAAVKTLLTYAGCELAVEAGGATIRERVVFAAFSNTPTYGGGHPVAPAATIFDGNLDYCLFLDRSVRARFAAFLALRGGRHVAREDVRIGVANVIRVDGPVAVAVTLDGELTCLTTPAEIRLMAGAIRLIGARPATPTRAAPRSTRFAAARAASF